MKFRAAVPDDAEAIARVQVRSAQAGFAHIFPAEALATLDPEPRVALWRERLPLVAEDDGAIVGFVHVGPSTDEEGVGEVYRIFVLPERWGTGIGRGLVRRALEQLRASGFAEATLWVHDDNPRARRFYDAGGWRLDGADRQETTFGVELRQVRYRVALR